MRDYDAEILRAALDPSIQHVFARDSLQSARAAGRSCCARQHAGVVAFNVYPRTDRDIELNELLWRVVQESSFNAAELEPFLLCGNRTSSSACRDGVAAFALGIPITLMQFLETVTLDEMHTSVIHMLADAAQGEDEDGLQLMRDELSPSIWDRLEQFLRQDSAYCNGIDASATIALRSSGGIKDSMCNNLASRMLDMALQSSQAQNYWSVDIQGTLLEPCADGETCIAARGTILTTHSIDRAAVIHHLYQDWCVYARTFMAFETSQSSFWKAKQQRILTSLTPRWTTSTSAEGFASRYRLILNTLTQLIRDHRHALTWQRAELLLLCANRPGNDLSRLPQHVIYHEILPRVVLEEAHGIRDASSVVSSRAINITPGPHFTVGPTSQHSAVFDDMTDTETIFASLEDLSDVLGDI